MKCDIIIPIWNQLDVTQNCIMSIFDNTHYPFRLILVDNASDEKTKAFLGALRENADVKVITNKENLGFVKAVNQGLKASSAEYICVMNNDTVATDGWLGELVYIANSHSGIGLVNPSSNNLGQDMGKKSIDEYAAGLEGLRGQYIEMGACIGFCMLFKREIYEKLGKLDEVYKEGNFDDTDYSRRAEKEGYVCARAKGAYVYHRMKTSFQKVASYEESFKRNQDIYNRRWGKPKRLLYIVTKSHGKLHDWMKDDIYEKARGGNWIWLYFKEMEQKPAVREHSNMKLLYLAPVMFELNCIMRILSKKKSFDSVYVDDAALQEKIRKLEKLHKAETVLIGG